MAARILHQDQEILILDKPAGLAVHPGPRGGPSLSDWLPALQQGRRHLPQPAHRLDMDTSGCLALGRTKPAIAALNRLFAEGRTRKTYWAVLIAPPPAEEGVCEAALLKRSSKEAGWRMFVDPAGLPARTEWRVIGRDGAATAVELTPRTGRTHQLRLHMSHLGCPIRGDGFYGGGEGRLQLLARTLILPLEPERRATAPIPDHMREALARCGVS
ncbi:RluA family pseudouridine synthase [Roseococcus sp. SYP-B2431]|uniref:RluA family pseudouridine synthase n=1 Tax=Roseococcus sp. SYP-B2431 TaxID=2496640 RepID=UPI001F10D304|nr:RluA family pseudouridine synthase [Roseococcus sp. SYP-B2431]